MSASIRHGGAAVAPAPAVLRATRSAPGAAPAGTRAGTGVVSA